MFFDPVLKRFGKSGVTLFGYALKTSFALSVKCGPAVGPPVQIDQQRNALFAKIVKMRKPLDRLQIGRSRCHQGKVTLDRSKTAAPKSQSQFGG